jgi:predicted DNA-binding ribbon-helix-helix protein
MCQMFAGQTRSNYQFHTRSLRLNGQCTSLRLEQKFWHILDEIAEGEGISTPQFISKLHTEVVALHGEATNFSSMLRCTCLIFMEKQADALSA